MRAFSFQNKKKERKNEELEGQKVVNMDCLRQMVYL